MAIAYATPDQYQFDYFYGGPDAVLAAPSVIPLSAINLNPLDLLAFQRKGDFVPIPESQGELYITDGYQAGVDMELFGMAAGANPNDTFVTLVGKLSRFVHATGYKYLRAGLHDGTSKVFWRRYIEPVSGGASLHRRTRYEAVDQLGATFRAYDPSWYQDDIEVEIITVVNGTTGNVVTVNTGDWHSHRCLVTITRTADGTGATPTNPVLSHTGGESLTITDTLPSIGDYWVIDMLNGAVTKSVSSVLSNAISKFSGQFFPIRRVTDTITCTSTTSASYTVNISYLPRMS